MENTIIKQFTVIKKFEAYDFIAAANSQSHVMSQNTMHIKHNISWINDRHAPLKRKKNKIICSIGFKQRLETSPAYIIKAEKSTQVT